MEKRRVPELVVMLTHDDMTVDNAIEVFEACKDSQARCWGFKEHPLPAQHLKRLCSMMKESGKTVFLEVVAYTEEEGLSGARLAAEVGCDFLMGTTYFDSINRFCKAHGLRYMPFVGQPVGRPSVLNGTIEGMVAEARSLLAKGVYGFDLLGYRFVGDAVALNAEFVSCVDAPVCLAGSIDGFQRLGEVRQAAPWAFTIGSAFFDNKFGGTISEQINKVCSFMSGEV